MSHDQDYRSNRMSFWRCPHLYIAAVAVGAVVTAVCVNVLKSLARKKVSQVDQKEDDLDLDFEMN